MIEGEKIFLRALERKDLELLHNWFNDADMMRWGRFKPSHSATMDALEKDYEQELKGVNATRRTFMIVEKRSRDILGSCSLRWYRAWATTVELGILIADQKNRGRGFGTETVKLLVELAFNQHNAHKVELFTLADNKAMIGVSKKLGFVEEGKHRETLYFDGKYHDGLSFGLLREDYGDKKPNGKKY